VVRTETHAWSSNDWHEVGAEDIVYNNAQQVTSRTDLNGGKYEVVWIGDERDLVTDRTGVKTKFNTYDDAGRVIKSTRLVAGEITASDILT